MMNNRSNTFLFALQEIPLMKYSLLATTQQQGKNITKEFSNIWTYTKHNIDKRQKNNIIFYSKAKLYVACVIGQK